MNHHHVGPVSAIVRLALQTPVNALASVAVAGPFAPPLFVAFTARSIAVALGVAGGRSAGSALGIGRER